MTISVKTTNDVKILLCEGALDTQTSPEALSQLQQLIEEGARKVLVNFEALEYISSAGLHVLLTTAKQMKSVDGELRICGLNEVVKEVFDISGFMTILKVFGAESDALEGF
ncbi:MAG: STAS domain-containing protein [Rhodospirillales bacterium]